MTLFPEIRKFCGLTVGADANGMIACSNEATGDLTIEFGPGMVVEVPFCGSKDVHPEIFYEVDSTNVSMLD